ncbi:MULTISPECIES: heavy-metal-associated domain-containing protein [Pedobacter]|uniref:heavy-metal-associated domain-containing protein n=1 Tax=Pedobacter TaxID=84567 RepID=UPI00210D40BD|nr:MULTISPECIES: cation transporter [unclassified Pedobacter]
MHTLAFKTNIKCGGCIAAVTPVLDQIPGDWKVDTESPDKILTISTDEPLNPKEVIIALDQVGYQAEKI